MEHVKVNGVELAYEIAGAAGEVVVLLNGIAMSISHWRAFAGGLEAGRRILMSDLRGQLLSGRPAGPYSLELHAEDLAALLDRLGIEAAHIVGTSYGSEVGLVFARLYPERCRSLVVIDGASEAGPLLRAAVLAWRSAALVDPLTFYRCIVPWTYSEGYIRDHGELLRSREAGLTGLPRDYFDAFAALCDSFLQIDETGRLAEISCPTLVLVGSEDILKPPAYARTIAAGIPGSRLEILPGLGHGAVIEDPRGTAERVGAFLGSLAPAEEGGQ
ncbi:MAG TPA: alpha/beta fold hydrolase [Rectinemataceae bacterium]|nr:alpha/beta fold hydrolase [Rectinemataceae bacterium]